MEFRKTWKQSEDPSAEASMLYQFQFIGRLGADQKASQNVDVL